MPSKLVVVVALLAFNLLLAAAETALLWPENKLGVVNVVLLGFLLYGVIRGNESIRRLLITLSWVGLVFAGLGLVLTIPLFTTLIGSLIGILTILVLVIGATRSVYLIWCLNQPDVQRWMFERSLEHGRVAAPRDDAHKAVDSARLGSMQRNRKRVVVAASILVGCGVVYFVAREPIAAYFEKKDRDARIAADIERYRVEREKRAADPAATTTMPGLPGAERASASVGAAPLTEKTFAEIAVALHDATDKRLVLRTDVARSAELFYGAGFRPSLRQIGKVPDEKHELAILPSLSGEARGAGCGAAMDEASAASTDRATVFASKCPPPSEPRGIPPKKLADVPLWAGALAVLLELRARDQKTAKDPFHQEVIAALLAEREP